MKLGENSFWEFLLSDSVIIIFSPTQQPLYTYLKTSAFLSSFLPSYYALFRTFNSERNCTPVQCFYKGCTQSNQQWLLVG